MQSEWWFVVAGDEWALRFFAADMPFVRLQTKNDESRVSSDLLNCSSSADAFWQAADAQVRELNELGVLADWTQPLVLTGVAYEVRPDGIEYRHLRPVIGTMNVVLGNVRMRATATVTKADGSTVPPPRTIFERARELRLEDPVFADALVLLRAANGERRVLWIVWECIREGHGWPRGKSISRDRQHAIYEAIGIDEERAVRFWQSAHLDRHYKAAPVPGGEMSSREMQDMLEGCLRAWVDRVVPS